MRRGMESISLWHCSGVMRAQVALIVAFSSSVLLGLAYRIFLFTIPHRFSMGLRSGEFAGQLRTGIPWSLNQVLVSLALCAENIREHNFGPLSSSPVLFVFSPGETLLTLSVVQEWLDTRNATAETHVLHTSVRSGSWSTDSSCSPLFVNLPHIFEWVLVHNPL